MLDYFTSFFSLFFSAENQLWIMFLSAFLSATILPGNSEIIFSTLLTQHLLIGQNNLTLTLFIIATVGNSLGSLTTYLMARLIPKPLNESTTVRWALQQSEKYGGWLLLLSWLPVIGDILCGVAGWLRLNFWQSVLFITLGKAIRYGLLWWGIATFLP
ncbi:hypothetical protein A6B43_01925 [Vespertiliibacter pulmonis]|uniref:Membrane protein YqaA with SNARE-associated domain n=1 Tax=Vespertiliibacter pulmonis TaxID=1443036 RepID=A0A3N4VYY1_9PAST|nr:VTT domain-containing protein [Vespertiliibacter pulmonis]QLB20388.1 hypothetical protein A6B43_01925 [Vespertiliibacter pulmonis]RPE86375.1 membrane protein YqaA with SNARE-associated domain [Vespertiliibacter pulmonis]